MPVSPPAPGAAQQRSASRQARPRHGKNLEFSARSGGCGAGTHSASPWYVATDADATRLLIDACVAYEHRMGAWGALRASGRVSGCGTAAACAEDTPKHKPTPHLHFAVSTAAVALQPTRTKPRGVPQCPWGCCAARGAAQQGKQAWGQMGTEWGQHGDTKPTWVANHFPTMPPSARRACQRAVEPSRRPRPTLAISPRTISMHLPTISLARVPRTGKHEGAVLRTPRPLVSSEPKGSTRVRALRSERCWPGGCRGRRTSSAYQENAFEVTPARDNGTEINYN